MSLSLVTAPAFEPISLNEAKLHLRVDTTADDSLIEGLIRAATEYAQSYTGRSFVATLWDDKRCGFPCDGGPIVLPRANLLTSTAPVITYVDQNGDTQPWSSSLYTVNAPAGPQAMPGQIYPNYGEYYPATRSQENAVTVRFLAGYGGVSKTVSSITRSSTTATLTTSAAHGYSTGQRVTIAGSDQSAYNGTFEITVAGAATFTFTVAGSPTTPATGVMTAADLGIPASILTAIKALVGHWYEHRESVSAVAMNVVPQYVDAMLWPYKVFA